MWDAIISFSSIKLKRAIGLLMVFSISATSKQMAPGQKLGKQLWELLTLAKALAKISALLLSSITISSFGDAVLQERQRYLQRLLKTHANIKFSEVDVSEYSAMAANRKTRFD